LLALTITGTAKARDDAKVQRDTTAHRLAAVKQALARTRAGSRPEEIQIARARVAAMEARIAKDGLFKPGMPAEAELRPVAPVP
jgi:hypothetical protein